MRILLVEDEEKIASFLKKALKEKQYAVDESRSGEEGLYMAINYPYDLIILDIMLPAKDGISVCRELRGAGINTSVLMLTARDTLHDKVKGLDSGADDYLTKPFSIHEFLARVRALLRRGSNTRAPLLKVADLELDQITHKVKRGGTEIELTSTEYSLLEYFMLNVGQVVTRTMISEHVWDNDFDRFSNVINVYVTYLRQKIDKGFEKALIHTIRGVGYVMEER